MGIIQTVFQQATLKKPVRFEQLRELDRREGLKQHEKLKDELLKLEKGFIGESYFEKLLVEQGDSHWQILKNLWLDCNGEFECDFLVFTQAGGYTFSQKGK